MLCSEWLSNKPFTAFSDCCCRPWLLIYGCTTAIWRRRCGLTSLTLCVWPITDEDCLASPLWALCCLNVFLNICCPLDNGTNDVWEWKTKTVVHRQDIIIIVSLCERQFASLSLLNPYLTEDMVPSWSLLSSFPGAFLVDCIFPPSSEASQARLFCSQMSHVNHWPLFYSERDG